jgi:hypothetical protein
VVGDRERIETELAEALITRLQSAGLELHRGLALSLGGEARDHIELAIDEIDTVINLVRVAVMGFNLPEDSASPP